METKKRNAVGESKSILIMLRSVPTTKAVQQPRRRLLFVKAIFKNKENCDMGCFIVEGEFSPCCFHMGSDEILE